MNYYVFIDNNNGHFHEYYNFSSNATKAQIEDATEKMLKDNADYGRTGSKVFNLADKLVNLGFVVNLEDNSRNRLAIDRAQIYCISGNY